jgi:hypothetical protein
MYKMNYLKASIGIRRSENEAENILTTLKKKYKDVPTFSNVSLEQLRIYQCAFAIFDRLGFLHSFTHFIITLFPSFTHSLIYSFTLSLILSFTFTHAFTHSISDGSDTIDMKELLDTLEVYGRGHQILDRYSDKIANSSGKVQRQGKAPELRVQREGKAKKLAEKVMRQSKKILNPSSSVLETSLNLEEFVVFMEIVTHTGAKSSDLEVEFGSFCKNVMDVMLHTSEALGSIYRNLSSDIQKSFRSTSYLGKLCEEVPIKNGDVLYSRGEHPSTVSLWQFVVIDSHVSQVIRCGVTRMVCSSLGTTS